MGLNHAEVSLDKTLYFLADYEIFVPLSDNVPERFAAKARLRAGLGYRRDQRWRFELLYIRDGSLGRAPDIGRTVPEFANPGLRELIYPPFRIVYRRELKLVRVVRVWRSERLLKLPRD